MCAHLGDESTGRAAPGHASAAAFNRLPPGPHVRPVSTWAISLFLVLSNAPLIHPSFNPNFSYAAQRIAPVERKHFTNLFFEIFLALVQEMMDHTTHLLVYVIEWYLGAQFSYNILYDDWEFSWYSSVRPDNFRGRVLQQARAEYSHFPTRLHSYS